MILEIYRECVERNVVLTFMESYYFGGTGHLDATTSTQTFSRDPLRRRPVLPHVHLDADPFRRKLIKNATFPL